MLPKVKPDFEGYLTKRSALLFDWHAEQQHREPWRVGCRTAQSTRRFQHPRLFTCAGAWLKEWRRRYFRLIGNKLYFSKDTTVSFAGPGICVEPIDALPENRQTSTHLPTPSLLAPVRSSLCRTNPTV